MLKYVGGRCNIAVNQRERAKNGDVMDGHDLASAVRERRKHLGLTQAELADISGVSPRFVYDLERGKETIALDKARKVLETLGLFLSIEAMP
jgi:y4mF family transcriptional regulator